MPGLAAAVKPVHQLAAFVRACSSFRWEFNIYIFVTQRYKVSFLDI